MACGTSLRCLESSFQHNYKVLRTQDCSAHNGIRSAYDKAHLDDIYYRASENAYFPLLRTCQRRESLHEARRVYTQLIKQGGLELHPLLFDYLVITLVRCGGFEDAHNTLSEFPPLTSSSSWTTLISAYIRCSQSCTALRLYKTMLEKGVQPNTNTFVFLFKACGSIPDLEEGKKLHSDAHARGFTSDVYMGSSIISMYGKCHSIPESEKVFYLLRERNVVSWNAMLSSYLGKEEKVLRLYRQMQEEDVNPNHLTFVSVLKACSTLAEKKSSRDVNDEVQKKLYFQEIGQALHADARRMFFASNEFVGNTLISMYGKCKCLSQAENVFIGLLKRNIVSWNVMLSAYMEQHQVLMVLQSYVKLHEEGIRPDHETFMIVLQSCYNLEAEEAIKYGLTRTVPLEICQAVEVDVLRNGFSSDVIIASMLISVYSKHDSIAEAETVFSSLLEPDVIAWNAMLSAYVKHKQEEKFFVLFSEMLKEGICPDEQTFVACFQACGGFAGKEGSVLEIESIRLISLEVGQAIHAYAKRKGVTSSILVSNTLISMYGKCGAMDEANNVFEGMEGHDIISWNALLSAYVECSQDHLALQLYCQMHGKGMMPDKLSLAIALQACGNSADKIEAAIMLKHMATKVILLKCGCALHVDAQLKGFDSDNFVKSATLSMYYKCGTLIEAENVFLEASKQDLVLWNIMISAYLEHGQRTKALQLYRLLLGHYVYFNERTIVLALKACYLDTEDLIDEKSKTEVCLEIGQAVHSYVAKNGYISNSFVASALISMYSKCGCIREAEHVFDKMIRRTVIVWNSMLATYLEEGEGWKTLQLYREMQQAGVSPDQQTFVFALQACCVLADKDAPRKKEMPMKVVSLEIGEALHADAIHVLGVSVDALVGSTLVSMYGKCGAVYEAEQMFDRLHDHNIVTWNAMIHTYVEHQLCEKAIILYMRLMKEGLTINDATLMGMLQVCMEVGSLEMCQEIHFAIIHAGCDCSPLLLTSLIHAYGSSACMAHAEAIFDALSQPDVAAWSSLMAGFGRDGNFEASITILEEMSREGITADEMTYCSFLFSCSHTGNVSKAVECFESMVRGGAVTPKLWHYTSMLDLFGRAGDCRKIDGLMKKFPVRADIALWLSLLSACCIHANLEFAKHAFSSAVHLQPGAPAGYTLMSNIYSQFKSSAI